MDVDIIEKLRADLRGAKRKEVEARADEMNVPRGTLRKIVSGATENPRYHTVLAILADYERREDATQ